MAQLPRGLEGHLRALVAIGALCWALAPGAAAALELEGTWHVLVHYTDDNTSRPEQPRWNDRVWVFAHKAGRLVWTEYPIAVFGDESGRFERRASGQYARVLGHWEPSEQQLDNLRGGLEINTRGMRKKSLRGSDAQGWSSSARARVGSASVIGYEELWSIEGTSELPLFVQRDVLGGARTETLDGVTRYQTSAVEEEGATLRGRYERDGSRHGTFVMRRSGAVRQLEEKTQKELQAQAARRGAVSSQLLRAEVRELVETAASEEEVELSEQEIEALVGEALTLYSEGGRPREIGAEIRRRVRERAQAR